MVDKKEKSMGEKLRVVSLVVLYLFLLVSYVFYVIRLVDGGNPEGFQTPIILLNVVIYLDIYDRNRKSILDSKIVKVLVNLNAVFVILWGVLTLMRLFINT